MSEVLLLVDVINDFRHEDGDKLLASFEERHAGLVQLLDDARARDMPVVYANDNWGVWDGDRSRLVREAIEDGSAGDLIKAIAPRSGDRFVVKPRHSAFHHTPLRLLLDELGATRVLLAGAATEMCVAETAVAGRELGYEMVVVPSACAALSEDGERVALDYLSGVLEIELLAAERV